jgi:predicted nucleotidyltransferase
MNVAGFEDAYQHSITIILRNSPHLEIQIASLASQMVLKLIAWKDRGRADNRDAKDIAQIIKHYGPTVNMDRLYEEEYEVMEQEEHDLDLAGARLLGRDIVRSTGTELKTTVLRILGEETAQQDQYRVADALSLSFIVTEFEQNLLFLKKVETGLTDS